MPVRFKQRTDHLGALGRAARARVQDEPHVNLSEDQVKARVNKFLRADNRQLLPGHKAGGVLRSGFQREFVKDIKFFSNWNALSVNGLQKDLRRAVRQVQGRLRDIEQDARGIGAYVTEEEIKRNQHWSFVHHNEFVRREDLGLGADDQRLMVDYKTGGTFLPEHIVRVQPGSGAMLPLTHRQQVPVVDIQLVGEKTDVGDSRQPLISNDPRNILIPDKLFRHVIVRREHDSSGRRYKRSSSRCTLLLELAGQQLFNHLQVSPASHVPMQVSRISYLNEAAELVDLEFEALDLQGVLHLFIEPIRARYLEVELRVHAAVTKDRINTRAQLAKVLNRYIQGLDWHSRLPEDQEELDGRVLDFSIRDLQVGLNTYSGVGIFRSQDQRVPGIRSVSTSLAVDFINVSEDSMDYSTSLGADQYDALVETYLGLKCVDKQKNVVFDGLVPMPDGRELQREYLVFSGNEARAKLFPDMLYTLRKREITSTEGDTNPFMLITTEHRHGIDEGERFTILGPVGHALVGVHRAVSVTARTIRIEVQDWGLRYRVTPNTYPRLYVHKYYEEGEGTPAFTITSGDQELQVGEDFRYSLDGGRTYYDTFVPTRQLMEDLLQPTAGDFKIKLAATDLTTPYIVQYRVAADQDLGMGSKGKVRGGVLVLDPALADTVSTVNTVIVIRAGTNNPLLSPLLNSYNLKIRTKNVS